MPDGNQVVLLILPTGPIWGRFMVEIYVGEGAADEHIQYTTREKILPSYEETLNFFNTFTAEDAQNEYLERIRPGRKHESK